MNTAAGGEGQHAGRVHDLIAAGAREAAGLRAMLARPLPPRDAVPGYEILDEIGRGGMGVVYRALQLSTEQIVAIKVMLAGHFASAAARDRFVREVKLTARLRHPGIVRVHDGGVTPSGHQYYVMDYVDGVSLDQWLRQSSPDARRILGVFSRVCAAVEHAHRRGVVHRDLKPANVLVDAEDEAHVVDFGLAKALAETGQDKAGDPTISMPGQVVGTLRYLSPEQAEGRSEHADRRTDVYALGVMLYEAMTGAPPVNAGSKRTEVLANIREELPKPPSSVAPGVRGGVETIILEAMEKDPARRYASAGKLGEDIEHYLHGEPLDARGASVWYTLRKKVRKHGLACGAVAGLLAIALVATGAVVLWRAHNYEEGRRAALSLQREFEAGVLQDCLAKARDLRDNWCQIPEVHLVLARAQFCAGQGSRDLGWLDPWGDSVRTATALSGASWAAEKLQVEICTRLGLPKTALPVGQPAATEPRTAEEWYVASFATLDASEAIRRATQAVSCDPDHSLAWERLLFLCIQTEDDRGALQAAEKLTGLGQSVSNELIALFSGYARLRNGRYREAAGDFSVARNQIISAYDPYEGMACAHLCLRDYASAENEYAEAARRKGVQDNWSIYRRATALWILGRLDEAVEVYKSFRVKQGRPSFADPRLYVLLRDQARELRHRGRLSEAQVLQQEADQVLAAAQGDRESGATLLFWVIECLAGRLAPEQLAGSANRGSTKEMCTACYYAAEACRLRDEPEQARRWFEGCVNTQVIFDPDSFPDPMAEYHLALWRLDQLDQTP